jgi:hypothetical protein
MSNFQPPPTYDNPVDKKTGGFSANWLKWFLEVAQAQEGYVTSDNAVVTGDLDVDGGDINLDGNLNFIGDGRSMTIKCDGGTLADWTTFVSNLANNGTTVVARPNGSAQAAAFAAADVSDLSAAGNVITIYANAGVVGLDTQGINGNPAPPLDLKVNGATMLQITALGLGTSGDLGVGGNINTLGDLGVSGNTTMIGSLQAGAFGANGAAPQAPAGLPAAAVDPATTQALVNAIRTALIANGIAV